MSDRLKNKLTVTVLGVCMAGLALCCWSKPVDDFSDSERRALQQMPHFSVETVQTGAFMDGFEDYAADQFPFRETFRELKAFFSAKLMRQRDNNGIYVTDGTACQMEYPLDEASIIHAAERFTNIYEKYLAGTDVNVYVSVVPDKNYFLAEPSGHLSMDYDVLIRTLCEGMTYAQYIEIRDVLSAEDYYRTDTHWRQEELTDVADVLLRAMGVGHAAAEYEEHVTEIPFRGVYAGQSALPLEAEPLVYLTSDVLRGCTVYDHENDRKIGLYDMEKGSGRDPYELFLSGSLSMITIEDPAADTDRELILFRDSFGSSLAPLLVKGYRRITLLDIRYLNPELLGRLVEFDDQDVLFLYSTLVLNHSETIK